MPLPMGPHPGDPAGMVIFSSIALAFLALEIGLVALITRRRPMPDLAGRAPERGVALREAVLLWIYGAAVLLAGRFIGLHFFGAGIAMHLNGSLVGATRVQSPQEVYAFAAYNGFFFALVPYVVFRLRGYSHEQLNLRSANLKNDVLVIFVVMGIGCFLDLALGGNFLRLTHHQQLVGGLLSFIFHLCGTDLPVMIFIYGILLPRYCKLTAPVTAFLLGAASYPTMHVFERRRQDMDTRRGGRRAGRRRRLPGRRVRQRAAVRAARQRGDRPSPSAAPSQGGPGWSKLAAPGAVASSAPGKSCGLSSPDAITVTPSGELLAGGACDNPGLAGIFGYSGGAWHAAGPVLPGTVAGDRIQVLRLTATPTGNVALLLAGPDLFAAWTSDGGARWTVSPPLATGAASVSSAAFGSGGAVGVLLSSGKTATAAGPGSSWQSLPAAPPDTAVLAFIPSGARSAKASQVQALAAKGAKLTVWQLDTSSATWTSIQTITVPIQYGSSG